MTFRKGTYGVLVLDKKEGHQKVKVGVRSAAGKRKAGTPDSDWGRACSHHESGVMIHRVIV